MNKIEKYLSSLKPTWNWTRDRHKRDLKAVEAGEKPNLRYNTNMAKAYIFVLESMIHYKGEWAGKNFLLEKWQKEAISICFGWEKQIENGKWIRRFGESFWHIPKKNGKTILASGLAIADTIIRGEQGGEVYAFATKADQAQLAWDGFNKLLSTHPNLKKYHKLAYHTIQFTKNNTIFKKIGKDTAGDSIDGISCTFAVADEKHAHVNKKMEENIKSSMASRLQPHFLSISTAGFDQMTHYFEDYEYAKKVVKGIVEDDNLFVFIAEAPRKPKGDEYKNWYFEEKIWELANPNYGVSVKKDFMKKQAQQAKNRPEKLSFFTTKNLNVWGDATGEEFLSIEDWDRCKGEVDATGEYVGGLDLSLNDDMTCFVKVYKKGIKYHIKPFFYLPKIGIEQKCDLWRVNLWEWIEQGHITLTEGKNINYMYVYNDIISDIGNMKALCYDSYKAKYLIRLIEEPLDQEMFLHFEDSLDMENMEQYQGVYSECIPITQGFGMLSEPTNHFQDAVEDENLVHDGNPVLRWMVPNISIVQNPQGNIMLNKSHRRKKIDGVAAIINALALLLHKADTIEENVYESRGLLDFG